MIRVLLLLTISLIGLASTPRAAEAQDKPALVEKLFGEDGTTTQEKNAAQKTEQELYLEHLQDLKTQKEVELPFSSYDEIPQEALDDAQDFYEFCKQDYAYQLHYSCECLSTRYLDERIRRGPEVARTTIETDILSECVDTAVAAGTAYEKCMTAGMMSYPGGDITPEQYCECVANNYALQLGQLRNRVINRRIMESTMSRALGYCRQNPPTPNSAPTPQPQEQQ